MIFWCKNVVTNLSLWLQIVAYLLISAASSAIPLTNRFREGQDNIFTDSAASAISMAVFAFVSLALSALFSGYKLSTHSFIWIYVLQSFIYTVLIFAIRVNVIHSFTSCYVGSVTVYVLWWYIVWSENMWTLIDWFYTFYLFLWYKEKN